MPIFRARTMKPPPGSLVDPTHQLGDGVEYLFFNDGRGKQLTDAGPNRLHGTLTDMDPATDWVPGRDGFALDFDGGNDYVSFGDILDFERTDPFSIVAEIKTSQDGTQMEIVSKCRDSSPWDGYQLYVDGTRAGDPLEFALISDVAPSNYILVEGSTDMNDGAWHHVIITYDGSSSAGGVAIYVDGQADSVTVRQNTLSLTILNDIAFNIGSRELGGLPFTGQISRVVIYPRSLSANEASWLYHEPYSMVIAPDPAKFFSIPAVGVDELGAAFVQGGHFMEFRAGSVRAA